MTKKFSLFIHFTAFKKWCCHINMLVIETISHSVHFSWRVHAGHFISFTWFLKPRRMSEWMDKNNSREVSESWILPLSSILKYPHLLILKEPLYIHLTLPAVLCPQLCFWTQLHSVHFLTSHLLQLDFFIRILLRLLKSLITSLWLNSVGKFPSSFIHQTFVELLLCCEHCSRCWDTVLSKTDKIPGVMELMNKNIKYWYVLQWK